MEDQIRRLVDDYAEAERTNNVELMQAMLHDDFIGIGPLGFMLTKEQWLDRHASGDLAYEQFEFVERSIREYEHVAVVISRQNQVALFKDQSVKAQLRTSLTFMKVDGEWKLLGAQMSSIGQPPQFSKR
jgi:hypothetical protein